jgi:hypothetical protein
MATDSQTTRDPRDIQASDFQAIPNVPARLSAEVKFAPTCMMWCIVIGLSVLGAIVLLWALPMLIQMVTRG